MNKKGMIGVLGGMGPLATLEFFRRILLLTPASCDQDHFRVLIDNNPTIPDRTAAILHGGEDPLPPLLESARGLELAGADLIAIPCNAAHYYLASIRKAVTIPVLDMVGETATAVKERAVGLMATDGVLRSGLYHRACAAKGIRVLEPTFEDQKVIMAVIYGIKRRQRNPLDYCEEVSGVIDHLEVQGARAIILGCTELSLIPKEEVPSIPLYDALDILVQVAMECALAVNSSKRGN